MLRLILVAFLALTFVPALGLAADDTQTAAKIDEGHGDEVLLAKRRKKRRRRRKKMPAPSMSGETVHAEQEGRDKPYKYEVGFLSDFAIVSQEVGDTETGSGVFNMSAKILYIIGQSLEVGGQLDYDESTSKGDDSETVNRTYVLTVLGAYNFGNLDEDTSVFFINGGFGFGSNTTKFEAGDVSTDSSGSITRFTFGVGMHFFVDSNVALTGQFSYDMDTIEVDGQDDPTKSTAIHIAEIGFTLFI